MSKPEETLEDILTQYNEYDNLALKGIVPDRSGVKYLSLEEALDRINTYFNSLAEEIIYVDGKREYSAKKAGDVVAVASAASMNSLRKRQAEAKDRLLKQGGRDG